MGAVSLFTSSIKGPPPGTSTVGLDLWIDLGLITTGKGMWIGSVNWVSNYKVVTFNLCTNQTGQSTGSTGTTSILWKWTSSSKAKSITQDLYQKGTLHIKTVVGTGVEHWWLHLTSSVSTAQAYNYTINYLPE